MLSKNRCKKAQDGCKTLRKREEKMIRYLYDSGRTDGHRFHTRRGSLAASMQVALAPQISPSLHRKLLYDSGS